MKLLILLSAALGAQEKPVQLYRGMGMYHHPIQTTNPEAQQYFDQGLVLLYGFNRYEALRSFRKAADLDPKAAMPYWGLAAGHASHINMDLDGDVDIKKACGFARQASERASAGIEMEYAQAALAMCRDDGAYQEAVRELHRRHPDDPDAATLFAERLMVPVRWWWFDRDGKPAGEMAESIRVLETVLRRDPEHPGANHFYIHAVEMSRNPERAIPSAQKLMGTFAPNAGHLVHMAGHIFMRAGEYEIVANSNERAIQVDEEYFHHSGVHGGYMGYYAHNIHFLVAARMMQGRFDDAYPPARKMIEVMKPFIAEAPHVADAFVITPVFVLLRFHKWREILDYPMPEGKIPITQALWYYARAWAFHATGDAAKAEAARAEFEKRRGELPADAIFINNKGSAMLELASEVLKARMAANAAPSIPHWRRAVEIQDALVYDEPPPWYFQTREGLGSALLKSGNAREAEQVFREELDRTPRSGRVLAGLHQALLKQGRNADAAWVKAELDRASKRAQVPLTPEGY